MSVFPRRRAAVESETPHTGRAVQIGDVVERHRVVVHGQVIRMRARPTSGEPTLAVTVADETGSLVVVWTGRRAIGGITLGRRLEVEGVARRVGTSLEMTNPSYTLLP
jgi:RecG-like helicase